MRIETTADVRQFLIEQMVKTAEGKIEVGQAKAMCNFAQQVYNTIKLELQYASMRQKEQIIGAPEALRFAGSESVSHRRKLRAA